MCPPNHDVIWVGLPTWMLFNGFPMYADEDAPLAAQFHPDTKPIYRSEYDEEESIYNYLALVKEGLEESFPDLHFEVYSFSGVNNSNKDVSLSCSNYWDESEVNIDDIRSNLLGRIEGYS
jgi:hypothetical protein